MSLRNKTKKLISTIGLSGLALSMTLITGCSSDDDEGLLLNSRIEDGLVILGSDPVIDEAYKVQKKVTFETRNNVLKPVGADLPEDKNSVVSSKKPTSQFELERPYDGPGTLENSNSNFGMDYTDSSTFKSLLKENVNKVNKKLLSGLTFDDQGKISKTKISKQSLSSLMDSYAADFYKSASDQQLSMLYKYVSSALNGDAEDQASLADFYLDGYGNESYEQIAVSWYLLAANNGSTYSKYMVSILYQLGLGVEQDLSESVNWYKKASESKDSADAKVKIARKYMHPTSLITDSKQAFVWMESAANQGSIEGQYLLGDMYINGIGVDKSDLNAITWLGKAAEKNSPYAQYSLGVMYYNGQGTEQNLQEAQKWIEKAALQGYSEAQYLLGRMYQQGFGIEKNLPKAYAWWKMIPDDNIVADNFDQKLGNLISSMLPKERAEAEQLAIEYKKKLG